MLEIRLYQLMIKSNDKKIIYIIFLFPGLFSRIGYSKIGIAYISDVRQKWRWSYWFQVNLITYPIFIQMIKILFLFISENSWLCYMWCPMEVQKRISSRYGILLPKLFWPTMRKIVLVIEKNFWNSRLKAENLQKVWNN